MLDVRLVQPAIDLAIFDISAQETSQGYISELTLTNLGNVDIDDCKVTVTYNKLVDVVVDLDTTILGLQQLRLEVGNPIDLRGEPLETVCAKLNFPLEDRDLNLLNNEFCAAVGSEVVIQAPYPNPTADGRMTLEFISEEAIEEVVLHLRNPSGQIIQRYEPGAFSEGWNNLELDLSSVSRGIYFLHVQLDSKEEVLTIVKL